MNNYIKLITTDKIIIAHREKDKALIDITKNFYNSYAVVKASIFDIIKYILKFKIIFKIKIFLMKSKNFIIDLFYRNK
jgi:hypothetical protein